MRENYPIKYAIVPMYEPVGWLYGEQYSPVCYIVSKCYVVSEIKRYFMSGDSKFKYEVVFPFEKYPVGYNIWSRVEPRFDYNKCINSIVVEEIFDTYDEAVEKAKELNDFVMQSKFNLIPGKDYDEKVRKLEKIYNEVFSIYKDFEIEIDEKTDDLVVNAVLCKENSIVMLENPDLLENLKEVSSSYDRVMKLNYSLYDLVESFRDVSNSLVVYSISLSDYKLIEKQLEDDRIVDKSSLENVNFRVKPLLIKGLFENVVRIVDFDSIQEKGCFYLDIATKKMKYDDKMVPFHEKVNFEKKNFDIKVYTTETYEDIIKSYISNYCSDKYPSEIEVNGKVYAKSLKFKHK